MNCEKIFLVSLQDEYQRAPVEIEELKTKEQEFLERIRKLEESCSKLEIQLQTTSAKNTKLEMKISAMENVSNTTSNKLSVVESENNELLEKVKELSGNLKEVSKEKIDLEQAKLKITNENDSMLLDLVLLFQLFCKS